jgi:hypothetical protein
MVSLVVDQRRTKQELRMKPGLAVPESYGFGTLSVLIIRLPLTRKKIEKG